MATRTVGFAIDEGDDARLDRLVDKYGGGNRSAFLRVALDHMEALERSERLRRLQSYGAARAAERDLTLADVEKVVKRVLSPRRKG
jgi:Arc/MetJ-type ribon-helix-helix transcriptional regulator